MFALLPCTAQPESAMSPRGTGDKLRSIRGLYVTVKLAMYDPSSVVVARGVPAREDVIGIASWRRFVKVVREQVGFYADICLMPRFLLSL